MGLWDWAHSSVTVELQMSGGSVLPTHLGVSPWQTAGRNSFVSESCLQRVVYSLCRGSSPKSLSFMGVHACTLLTVLVAASYFLPTAVSGLWRCWLLGGSAVWVVTSLPSAAWLDSCLQVLWHQHPPEMWESCLVGPSSQNSKV